MAATAAGLGTRRQRLPPPHAAPGPALGSAAPQPDGTGAAPTQGTAGIGRLRAACGVHHPQQPFVLLAQQSLHDPSRVTHGRQVVWAYCHVPHASTKSLSGPIDRQIERFAPASRSHPRASGHLASPAGAAQPQLRRRRHFRRFHGRTPVAVPPRASSGALRHTAGRGLPVLGLDTARRRGPRHVWVPRSARGTGVAGSPTAPARALIATAPPRAVRFVRTAPRPAVFIQPLRPPHTALMALSLTLSIVPVRTRLPSRPRGGQRHQPTTGQHS